MRISTGVVTALLLLQHAATAQAAAAQTSSGEAHAHQGMSKPYKPGKPSIVLSSKQISLLNSGDMVQDQIKVEGGGRALAVQDVHAPVEYVWDRILDFPAYPKMVPKVAACYNYFTQTLRNNTQIIKTRLKLNVFGVKLDNYIYHTYYPNLDSLTWTLDYSKRSTLDDSVGYWYIVPHPEKVTSCGCGWLACDGTNRHYRPDWTRVYYSVQLRVPSWVPGIVISYLNKKAIREANSWVKRESEAKYAKDLASGKLSLGAKKGVLGAMEPPSWLSKGLFAKEPPPPPPPSVIEEPKSCLPANLAKVAKVGVGAGAGYLAWRALQRCCQEKDD